MASVVVEMRRSGNECVIWNARCSAQELVDKVVLWNLMLATCGIEIKICIEI